MNQGQPLILIANDDGYQAKGLRSLVEMVRGLGSVLVCAPDSARSGYSCAFSATTPLRLDCQERDEGLEIWSCNGTPVDCVKLALSELCPRRPDLILGGINHGDNGSVNAHYSGTMGVALEGCMKGIPSVAYSLCDFAADADFSPLRPFIQWLTRKVLAEKLPANVCLNVNFPSGKTYRGVRVCRMAPGSWINEITRCHHPRGYDYFWMVGRYRNDAPDDDGTDHWALANGYIAITPTTIDVTHYAMMEEMGGWQFPIVQDQTP